ncbi:MAG TPA: DUF6504 family protein [Trebonia sp.]
MGRVYGEPVEVQMAAPAGASGGRPARFVWRGRLYFVRSVIGHWVVNREWWRDPETAPDQPEMLYWRVEAASGQSMPSGTYELRQDVSAGRWTLHRVVD